MHQRESLANLTNEQKHASNNIGVVLFAFGKPHYYGAAYNLAFSIKRFNSGLKIVTAMLTGLRILSIQLMRLNLNTYRRAVS